MARAKKNRQESRKIFGEKIRIISLGEGKNCVNDACGLLMKKRMAVRYKDDLYCSERCAIANNGG